MNSGCRFDSKINQWLPDSSTLTLLCENQVVGTLKFNPIDYIGVKPKIEKVFIAEKNTVERNGVMVGDAITYPGAFITFRI